ncbi:MAG: hypothetical protein EBS01_00385 [Verrucomicrobia bacterium]|nr:hypothetical protein [Verrucomicrobiota bacterium]
MGLFSRFLGALFNGPPSKPEDIVFEPIDGPLDVSPTQAVFAAPPLSSKRAVLQRVALEDLMPRIPPQWKRAGDWAPERLLELPVEARLDVGAERPLAFSLRYLVRHYPELFRDPGASEPDVGFDLSLEPLREPVQTQTEIPLESFAEAEQERGTFSDWEEEVRASKQTAAEARETMKALRKVRLPAPEAIAAEFDSVLQQNSAAALPASGRDGSKSHSAGRGANSRLRKILEAYADSAAVGEAPAASIALEPAEALTRANAPEAKAPSLAAWPPVDLSGGAPGTQRRDSGEFVSRVQTDGAVALPQTRFEELGLSLSRFPEVRGFALWLGQDALQTGDLGFDARGGLVRARLEKMLETALIGQGTQDGFLSVTVHQAAGGISIFGGGPCLVAVAHRPEGMPAHLRAWLCGWVSQPLRG